MRMPSPQIPAIWRVHGFDAILREALRSGILLTGFSAGMICWFEAGVIDSFGPHLEGMRDGLGFLAGSACPHYDGEEHRRPVYERLVREGFPPELREVVSSQGGVGGYRVGPEGEEPVEARAIQT